MTTKNFSLYRLTSPIILGALIFPGQLVLSQESEQEEMAIEEIVTIGFRGDRPRSVSDFPVPVDVISGEDFTSLGNTADITDNLKTFVPSYNAPTASGDNDSFIRPTALRGMAPDQTLVMINGKRKHRAANIALLAPHAGRGSQGPNVATIPSIALKQVEVLRDGASSQYGSDAIAGVINFVLKDAAEGGEAYVQYGQFYENEESLLFAGNIGLPLGNTGFVNLSLEYSDNDALSRGTPPCCGSSRANAVDSLGRKGLAALGQDTPFDDAPLPQTWGRPENEAIRFMINSAIGVGDDAELYLFSNYAESDGRFRYFWRTPDNSSLTNLVDEGFVVGEDGPLPAGYTPYQDGDQTDFSITGGLRGDLAGDIGYDFSVSYGENELDVFLWNSVNHALGLNSSGLPVQRDFDIGALQQEEISVNADFTKRLTDSLYLAVGAEWREETFTQIAGEENSYIGPGSSGFRGYRPNDAGEFSRDNYAVYGEMEQTIGTRALLQYAMRYEDFSDFGDTINGKVAGRFDVTDSLSVRAAVSTGFHAPTPGQIYFQKVTTSFDAVTGINYESGLVRSTHPSAIAAGGSELSEEEAVSYSVGFAGDFGFNTTLTVDFYLIEVDNRIYQTETLPACIERCGTDHALNITTSFFTNAIDIRSKGVDVVLTSDIDWGSYGASTDVTFGFNHNQLDVTDQTLVNGQDPVGGANVWRIENSWPENKWVLSANTYIGDALNFLVRLNYYGEHRDSEQSSSEAAQEFDPVVYVDMELGYDFNDHLRLTLGGSNIFDSYVDKLAPAMSGRPGVGLPYGRRSAANWEGGSWYVRAGYSW